MKKTLSTVVFFGSGPVAAASLSLLAKSFKVEAVVTKPRAAHHFGATPVLEVCQELGLPTHTPISKAELSHLFAKCTFNSPLGVVIDYGIIIAKDVIDYFPFGIINSHFSLLPQWRGADPISFAILSGQKQTGISLMLINEKMDEGPLLAQTAYDIPPYATAPQLTHSLIELSDSALQQAIPEYLSGKLKSKPQEVATIAASKVPTYSRKLTKADGLIDWRKPAEQIEREIRAFIEWPKSRTQIGEVEVIITKAHNIPNQSVGTKPGDMEVEETVGAVMAATSSGSLCIERLTPLGKKEMTVKAFLAGYGDRLKKLNSGDC